MLKTFFTLLVATCFTSSQANLPPTTIKGQSQSGAGRTTFNFQTPFNQATQTGGVNALIETGNTNTLINPGFEHQVGTTGWSVSGGSFFISTAPLSWIGNQSGGWTPPASTGATFASTAVATPLGLRGTNGEASCGVRNSTVPLPATLPIELQVWDGTNVIARRPLLNSSQMVRTTLNFPYPVGPSSLQLRLATTDTTATDIDIDECYLGPARNLGFGNPESDWIDAGQLQIGATTTPPTKPTTRVTDRVRYRREGRMAVIEYDYFHNNNTGSAAGSGDYLFSLPPGLNIDSSLVSFFTTTGVNLLVNGSASTAYLPTTGVININAAGANGDIRAYAWDATRFRLHGSSFYSATNVVSNSYYGLNGAGLSFKFTIRVPIQGWTDVQTVRLDQTNFDWIDGGEINFGATTTPPTKPTTRQVDRVRYRRVGKYAEIEYSFRADSATGGANGSGDYLISLPGGLRADTSLVPAFTSLVQLSTAMAGQDSQLQTYVWNLTNSSGNEGFGIPYLWDETRFRLALFWDLSTIGNFGSGVFGLGSNAISFRAVIRVPIQGWQENQNAPLLVGSVTSVNVAAVRIEGADVTCSAASSIVSQSGAVSSIGNRSSAACTLTLAAGVFSATPWSCTVTPKGTTAGSTACNCTSATSCVITGPSAADFNAYVNLQGPRI